MTADLLRRRAASLMRERAEAATPTYWFADDGNVFANSGDPTDGVWVAWDIRANNAEHIASWHPAVAVAVADLVRVIDELPSAQRDAVIVPAADVREVLAKIHTATDDLARAYLGETK